MIFWEDESGLMAVIPLIYVLAIQGKYPVFLHPEFPSGHTLSATIVAEGLMAGNTWCLWEWQQHFLSTPSSSVGAQMYPARNALIVVPVCVCVSVCAHVCTLLFFSPFSYTLRLLK